MISSDKIASLMQLILSSKESTIALEQALKVGDEKKVEEIKKDIITLNRNIKKNLSELKIRRVK
ncbi:MAG: hypothetical protein IB618_00310 [Candidatus Pacearchaeota archaeon]|nr:MAG: hypothetical protein IB618_00310 [Candidatus Pacearchaeota archaeon]